MSNKTFEELFEEADVKAEEEKTIKKSSPKKLATLLRDHASGLEYFKGTIEDLMRAYPNPKPSQTFMIIDKEDIKIYQPSGNILDGKMYWSKNPRPLVISNGAEIEDAVRKTRANLNTTGCGKVVMPREAGPIEKSLDWTVSVPMPTKDLVLKMEAHTKYNRGSGLGDIEEYKFHVRASESYTLPTKLEPASLASTLSSLDMEAVAQEENGFLFVTLQPKPYDNYGESGFITKFGEGTPVSTLEEPKPKAKNRKERRLWSRLHKTK